MSRSLFLLVSGATRQKPCDGAGGLNGTSHGQQRLSGYRFADCYGHPLPVG